jgi:Tfp pilus assembly protein PilN
MTSTIPNINLVPLAVRHNRQRRRLVTRWVGAIAATTVIVGVPGVYLGGNAVLSDPMMGAQIERVRGQLSANQTEIPRLQSRISVLEEKRKTLDLVRDRIEWRELFAQIVNASGQEIHFTVLQAIGGGIEGADPLRINVQGIATTQTEARSFVVKLESLGLFDQVQLVQTTRDKINEQEVIEFHIAAHIGDLEESTP